MMAVSKQYLPVVASLLNARRPKVDVNMAKSSGFTAVFYAVEKATPTILQALLRRGADPNVVILQSGSRGNTPLHYACMLEKTKHAELLLEYGADPTATNEHGQMPLQLLPADAVRSTKLSLKNLFEAAYNKIQAAKVKQLDQAPSFSSPASGGSARTDM
jgi:ankyrin repeat protein